MHRGKKENIFTCQEPTLQHLSYQVITKRRKSTYSITLQHDSYHAEPVEKIVQLLLLKKILRKYNKFIKQSFQ